MAGQDNRSMTSVTELLGRYCKDNEVAGQDNRSRTSVLELIGQNSQERTIRLSGQSYLETARIMDVQGVSLS